MHSIKFRGKSIDTDGWVYGDYSTSIENGDNGGIEVYYEETNTVLTYINSQLVYPETVGQYTGLKDRNGKDIYEGDIVNVSKEYGGNAYIPLVVDFKDGCFILRNANYMDSYILITEVDFKQVYEIIGNIYDNTELLKEINNK